MEIKVVDAFKEGRENEQMVFLEVDGKRIGAICRGSETARCDSSRILIRINPVSHGAKYEIDKTEIKDENVVIVLGKGEGWRTGASGVEVS